MNVTPSIQPAGDAYGVRDQMPEAVADPMRLLADKGAWWWLARAVWSALAIGLMFLGLALLGVDSSEPGNGVGRAVVSLAAGLLVMMRQVAEPLSPRRRQFWTDPPTVLTGLVLVVGLLWLALDAFVDWRRLFAG